MIYIEEKVPHKIPGKTSLFIQFDYNKYLIDIIKECGPCNFDKKTSLWEIPVTRLAKFINQAYKFDEIELKILKDKEEKPIEKIKLSKYKTKPYKYQEEAIQYGLQKDNFLLLDVPGLGKSLESILLAEELKKREKLQHCLVICGINAVKVNWEKEIEKHSKLDCIILGKKINKNGKVSYGSLPERLAQLKKPIKEFFVIVNIESLRDDKILKELQNGKNKFDMIIVDEVHKCKSPTATQSKNLLKLTNAKHKVAMTGTLLLNNPLDCYIPLKWIGEEKASFTNFKYQYCNFGGPFGNELISFKNIEVLKDQINSCSLRRTKDLLDLPPKTIINEYLDLSSEQEIFYNNIVNGVIDQVDKVKLTFGNLLALTTRLRQATACPSILTTENINNVKLDWCLNKVEELISNGNKVVIFSVFKEPVNVLYELLEQYNPVLCTGDISDNIIAENVNKFQTDSNHKVLLGTHSKMGTGFTLNAAEYEIMIDTPWTAGLTEQSEDRIHRVDNKYPAFIYRLWCNNTFDMRVKEIIDNKQAIGDYIVDNREDPKTIEILSKWIRELKPN